MNINDVLLYLSLKYNGEWLTVYDSLRNRERVNESDLHSVWNNIDCKYVSMLDDNYPEGLKSIYKPPFGLFYHGNFELVDTKPLITIFGQIDDQTKPYLDFIIENKGKLLWPDLANKEMFEVLKNYKTNNLFWFPEMKNSDNRTFHHLLEDEEIKNGNLFFSELWEKKLGISYADQLSERLYLGMSHKVLVLTKLTSKQMLSLAYYASIEDIKIVFKKDLFEDKMRKIFTKCKVWLIDDRKEILDYFFED